MSGYEAYVVTLESCVSLIDTCQTPNDTVALGTIYGGKN